MCNLSAPLAHTHTRARAHTHTYKHGISRLCAGLVRAAIVMLLLLVPLLVCANALLNLLGREPWYVRTLRVAANPMVPPPTDTDVYAAIATRCSDSV